MVAFPHCDCAISEFFVQRKSEIEVFFAIQDELIIVYFVGFEVGRFRKPER